MATLGTLLAPDLIQTGSCWQLCADVNGYSRSEGASLTTQACRGRRFRILERQRKRIAVQLLEGTITPGLLAAIHRLKFRPGQALQPAIDQATLLRPKLPAFAMEGRAAGGACEQIHHKPRGICLLYTSPSPRDPKTSRMPSSA